RVALQRDHSHLLCVAVLAVYLNFSSRASLPRLPDDFGEFRLLLSTHPDRAPLSSRLELRDYEGVILEPAGLRCSAP
ncbi:MAG TPA: hypothetical protein VK524_21745, partial [Polyangiaceae bacterium]|nr:hypothetical protein [Polyangiaceae bacterium]